MVDFRPFRGVRYSPDAGSLADLICPPYDVISPALAQQLLEKNKNNMVRMELDELTGAPADDRYTAAAAAFNESLESGVLVQENSDVYYLLRQQFVYGTAKVNRFGWLGGMALEPLGGAILPHEDTASGPKKDRLELMKETQANFSPIMMLYRDATGAMSSLQQLVVTRDPIADTATVDGMRLTLWAISDSSERSLIGAALAGQNAYIADGHHRYETALNYKDTFAAPDNDKAGFVLTCLIDFDDPGLIIGPYYRVLHDVPEPSLKQIKSLLESLFVSRPTGLSGNDAASLDAVVATVGQGQVTLGVVVPARDPVLLTPANDRIPDYDPEDPPEMQARIVEANVLQEMLFRPVLGDSFADYVSYVHDGRVAMEMVATGEAQVAFFIKGVPGPIFESVVGAGIRLPRKSTYFWPKLPSGLVINRIDGGGL